MCPLEIWIQKLFFFSTHRLLTSLKGHGDRVLDIGLSPNDKFLASSCQDRSLILWPSKHFTSNDHRSTRGNVAYDVCISWHFFWSWTYYLVKLQIVLRIYHEPNRFYFFGRQAKFFNRPDINGPIFFSVWSRYHKSELIYVWAMVSKLNSKQYIGGGIISRFEYLDLGFI